jgi:hypothetical protein
MAGTQIATRTAHPCALETENEYVAEILTQPYANGEFAQQCFFILKTR